MEIMINNRPILIKEYNGNRVVTFKDIDSVHERPEGTARRNFNNNRQHFIEGEDYFIVKPSDFQMYEFRTSEINNRGTILITESGYLMLVKSFTDELAWTVQRQLVNSYFRLKDIQKQSANMGDIISLARLMLAMMKEQKATPEQTAEAVLDIFKHYNIYTPSNFLPVKLKKVADDELDMVEFAMLFPNSSYTEYMLYRQLLLTNRDGEKN